MRLLRAAWVVLVVLLGGAAWAQSPTGRVEIVAQVTPSVGRAEPALRLPCYLLRKSFADIRKEAEESEPKPDLEKFADGLDVSPELKAWIKRTKTAKLSGEEFLKLVTVDDLFGVPEFYDAYISENAGDVGFPAPKYTDRDRVKNPEKYERQRKEYRELLRKFARNNPHTMAGIDIHLKDLDPGQHWAQEQSQRRQRVRHRALQFAQTKYLVAKTETDLEGRAALVNIPPGDYWLSSLEAEALASDIRLRWDTPVTVQAGRTTRIELSNLNAVPATRTP